MISRRLVVAGLAGLPAVALAQGNEPEFYPVPVELIANLERLQGAVTLGPRNADIRLYEFFDYNCGWCRRTSVDSRALIKANKDLAVVLVNYAVLGIPSISATRVALAFSRQKADRYLDFHEALFKRRGTIDGMVALDVAGSFGIDRKRLLDDADSDAVTAAMRAASQLGSTLGFQATPSYLVGKEGYTGFLDRKAKQKAVEAWRQCEKTRCA
ncbi:MAG: DsbA family protein [Beijerinckiaceae bacterium]|nr:DsbA family protein [Beijerinckiaceae bacterium]